MKRIILLALIAALLTACSAGAETSSSGVQAWLDQPVNGTVLPLGAFTLKAHARHTSGSGVNKVEFLVNGISIGAVDTDTAAPIVYAETTWNASTPGEYLISSRAYAGAESTESASVRVCVSDKVQAPTTYQSGSCADPILGAFPVPTEDGPTPTPGSAPFVEMKAEASPSYVYYGVCPPSNPTLVNFNVYVADPGAVLTIRVGYSLLDASGTVITTGGVETTSPGVGGPTNYLLSLDMNTATAGIGALVTQLEFTPEGLDVLGNLVTAATPHRISVEKCASSVTSSDSATITVPPPTIAPPTAVPPTFTAMPPADTTGPDIKNLYHSAPVYYGSCGSTFTMQALGVTDPSGIASVIFGYRYEGSSTSGYNTISGTPIGNGTYELIIDNNASNQAYNTLQGANGFIRWYVQAQDNAGNTTTINDQVGELLYCPG
ncbi:MAG: lipoprotein [Anaerolineales bacterium]|nr:lipoprotein [Anaerolineales bacterium]